MTQFRLYRHPQRGVEAVDGGHWLTALLAKEDRLVRQGYHYTGSVEASDRSAALDKARAGGSRPVDAPARPSASPAQNGGRAAPSALLAGTAAGWLLFAVAAGYWSLRDEAAPQPGAVALPPAAAALPVQNESAAAESEGFSAWMSYGQTRDYAARLGEQRLRVRGVEGRAEQGGQCRLRTEAAPAQRHWWYWWCAQPPEKFAQLDAQYRRAGYLRVQQQSYTDPQGREWLSGVWHKEAD